MKRRAASPPARNRRAPAARSSREQLLDVRVRRSTALRQRNHRALSVIFGIVLWVALAAGTVFGFRAITNKFFLENPEYNLRVVTANLDDLMSKDDALRISGIVPGRNIFRTDLGAAERAFRAIDQIDTVTIQRDWPDTITIKLTKRAPVAWLARAGGDFSADHALLLDAAGHTMRPYRVEPEYWRLPVIFISDPALIEQRDALAVADLQAALDLLAARAQRPASLLGIRSINVTKGYSLDVTDANKATITFAPQDPGPQLDRLQKLLENCRETGRQLDTVNLIPKKYTPVRFLLVSMQDAPAPSGRTNRKSAN
ncbi:MAG: FtsQ-type POTRA domain-containing protein [Terrimicrobiaceae bacterium]|nr:FtsQ-type POTRA domain-containing protein [Terrimicrobiaceae bacterium]